MQAVGLDYQQRTLTTRDLPPPSIAAPDHVLYRVIEVGICGTDRELAAFHFGHPPQGENFLTLGHEALGEVVETGPGVRNLRKGELVVPTIRRACPEPCACCAAGRRDLCMTGGYTERGIFGLHGFFAPLSVDREADLIAIPKELAKYAILVEPISSVEKAVESAFRCHPAEARTALVLGAGPIGILAALRLQTQGLAVTAQSLEAEDDPKVALLRKAGVRYQRAGSGKFDIVIEATGSPAAGVSAIERLGRNGVAALLGARNGEGKIPWLDMIRDNQTVLGSVNASVAHFRKGARTLGLLERRVLDGLVTRVAAGRFAETIPAPVPGAIKVVHVLAE